MATFRVTNSPSNAWATTNLVAVNPRDFDDQISYIIINDLYIFSIKSDPSIQPRSLGLNAFQRRWGSFSLTDEVNVQPFDPISSLGANAYLGSLTLEVSFFRKFIDETKQFDTDEMARVFCQAFNNQVLTKDQILFMDFHAVSLSVQVTGLEVVDFKSLGATGEKEPPSNANGRAPSRGVLMQQTSITFTKQPDSTIRLKGSSKGGGGAATAIMKPNFKFEDMGIGGLDVEFSAIFRRAFASRIFPAALVEKIGIQHVKGIVLYGPPGTGKTLIARQIGKMLNAREPVVVNGPEVLNKFVGQSEENIRKLFIEAEKEYKAKGDESGLHIIIFDELDAICKQRGSKNDGTGVGDSVVNQLLAKLDGVEQLNNILIIGMTNRLDMIDEALLRPGRLEVHMEISLPDEKGRSQILKIHTAKMRENEILDPDVNIDELASLSKNFSGAEIAGLVKSASSFAFNRHVKVGTLAGVSSDVENMKVNRADFLNALDEVRPSFGVSETELQQCVQNQVIPFGPHIERILSDGQLFVAQVRNSQRTPLVSLLLHGPTGSGKTALAATIAMASEFPFVKLVSPESMVGMSESAKVSAINKTFEQAYKSSLSVIVVDNLERLLDWVNIGPRFSNSVLQALLVLLKRPPPKDRRLFVVATTNQRSVLDQMELTDAFNAEIHVPNIDSLESVDVVLRHVALFDDKERDEVLRLLERAEVKLSLGIKKLLMISEMVRQENVGKVDKFVNTLCSLGF